jgi:hypothetical protein
MQKETIVKFIVKAFWPWFIKYIWPIVIRHIVSLVETGLASLSTGISKTISDRMQKRRSDAEEKATAASAAAEAATSFSDRAHHEAIANVWRQVAEQFRAENDTLKNHIVELTARRQQSLHEDMLLGEPVLENLEGDPSIVFGGTKSKLPALPYEQH